MIVSPCVSSCARQPECARLARCDSHSFSSYLLVSDVEQFDPMIDSYVCVCVLVSECVCVLCVCVCVCVCVLRVPFLFT